MTVTILAMRGGIEIVRASHPQSCLHLIVSETEMTSVIAVLGTPKEYKPFGRTETLYQVIYTSILNELASGGGLDKTPNGFSFVRYGNLTTQILPRVKLTKGSITLGVNCSIFYVNTAGMLTKIEPSFVPTNIFVVKGENAVNA
jgi:hypothetical protein